MNNKVKKLVDEAIYSEGVEELFRFSDDSIKQIDIFNNEYLDKIDKIKLPNTRFKILQNLLSRNIKEYKKINNIKGIDFTHKFNQLVEKYNDRSEEDVLKSEVLTEFSQEIINLHNTVNNEKKAHIILNINVDEKSYYDILKFLSEKYEFSYPEEKLIILSKKVKTVKKLIKCISKT